MLKGPHGMLLLFSLLVSVQKNLASKAIFTSKDDIYNIIRPREEE